MILLRTRLFAVLVLLTCSTVFASDQVVVFDVLNKPLAPYAGVRYASISLDESKQTLSQQMDRSQIQADFIDGRQLVGKVHIRLSTSVTDPQQVQATVFLTDNGMETRAAQSTFSQGADLELLFDGRFAESVRIELTGTVTDKPIDDFTIHGIVLSDDTRIMLLGDSITEAHYDASGVILDGYRHRLYRQLDQSYNIDFVGTSDDAPYEAHCDGGKRINAFYQNGSMDVRGPMNTHHPHIVGIHLGTNDINNHEDPVETAEHMRKLINYLLEWRYDANGALLDENIRLEHIIVSLIIPAKYQDELCIETNRYIALVVDDFISGRETGRAEPVHAVDHYSRFREWPPSDANRYYSLMWDRLHPNNAGHDVMTSTYFTIFDAILSGQSNRQWFTDVSFLANIIGTDYRYNDDNTTHFFNHAMTVADINNDGIDDIYSTRSNYDDNSAHNNLYLGNATLPFTDRTNDFGLHDPGGSRGAVFVDIDNDGDFDLFVGNSPGVNQLYENINGADFIKITNAGLENINATTTGVAAFDADNDGDMDLYAINSRGVNEFYLNNGDGHFTPAERGLRDVNGASYSSYAVAPADVDNDGDTDLFVTFKDATNKLFLNDGAGYFSDGTSAAGLTFSGRSHGASWSDLDLDGDLDLIVTQSRSSDTDACYLLLYENNGDGTFSDVSMPFNIPVDGFSTIIADFNNDGFDDFITTFEKEKAEFWENQGNWHFEKITGTGAEINGGDIRGASTLDYDNDGDMDIILARSDMLNVLLQNNYANDNNFIKIKAFGPNNNIGGFGTKIWLYETGHVNDPQYLIGFREIVSASGHMSQPSPTQHFGLSTNSTVDMVARFTNGSTIIKTDIQVNQTITIAPDATIAVGEPARIDYYGGNHQSATVGNTLAQPLQARVTDDNGVGVPDVYVPFTVMAGDAELYLADVSDKISAEAESADFQSPLMPVTVNGASNGTAVFRDAYAGGKGTTLRWHKEIGTPGEYYLWLRASNNGPSSIYVSMTVDGAVRNMSVSPGAWHWLPVSSDNNFYFERGQHTFELTVTAISIFVDKLLLVQDANYIPSGIEETLQEPNVTDSQGIAYRFVQLGHQAGELSIHASLERNGDTLPDSPIVFSATATAGQAVRLQKTSGDEQNGDPGVVLSEPLVVTLFDAFDNPVPDVPVSFSAPGGSLNPAATNTTNADGRAFVWFTPDGSSSQQQVRAEAAGLSPAIFTVYVSGVAEKMHLLSEASTSGRVMSPAANPVRVKVLTDSVTQEPARHYGVKFTTTAVGGRLSTSSSFSNADSVLTIFTDDQGVAQAYWQFGSKSGTQTLRINAGSIAGSPQTISAAVSPASPALLLLVDGNEQHGPIGEILAKPFRVRVTDAYGNAHENISVQFTSTSDGSFEGSSLVTTKTNSAGDARASYTLGRTAGYQKVTTAVASNAGQQIGSPVDFYATATAGTAASAAIYAGNNQSGTVDTQAEEPLVVRISDKFGNPVSGFDVTFNALSGSTLNGNDSAIVPTDTNGLAAVSVTLGKNAGEQHIKAETAGLTPASLDFVIYARSSYPTKISEESGNHQTGSTNSKLADSLVVRLTDRYGNNVPDHPVTFRVISDQGSFDGSTLTTKQTDPNGLARAMLTLGDELGDANNIVEASSSNDGSPLKNSPIIFYASAQVGTPHAVHAVSDTSNLVGAAEHVLPEPIIIKIVDKKNQPIAGFGVKFHVIAGFGQIQESGEATFETWTDADGRASAHWILGPLGVMQRLWILASHNGQQLQNSPMTIHASTVATTAQELRIVSGNNQTAARHMPLAEPFVVEILDTYGDPVSNHTVLFSMMKGDGQFAESETSSVLIKTTENGQAAANFILGEAVGHRAYEIAVRAFSSSGAELLNSPASFYGHGITRDLKKISGDNQSQPVTTTLPQPLRVRLVDENDNGIENESVHFEVASGALSFLGSSTQQTDSDGYAQIDAQLDTVAGPITVRASAPSFAASVFFRLDARPGAPVQFIKISGDNQVGVALHRLNQKIIVQLGDAYDNGIAGATIQFETQAGHGSVIPAHQLVTDSSGRVRAEWQLGSALPKQYLFVTSSALKKTLSFGATVFANQAPTILAADSFHVSENSNLSFQLGVEDSENDAVTVSCLNPPQGAQFDAESVTFSWTPTFTQSGSYWIIFKAQDEFEAASMKTVYISVENVNRPPVIAEELCRPQNRQLGSIRIPAMVDFSVSASDPDGDALFFLWQVNGEPKGTSSTFQLVSQLWGANQLQVDALVFDQYDTSKTSWTVELITAVALKSFSAAYKPYVGVELEWSTRYEWDNIGFFVVRSASQQGPFVPIGHFLKSTPEGEYQFIDNTAQAGETYFYQLQDVQHNGATHNSESITFSPPLPQQFALHQNYPNPFNPTTTIRFDVAEPSFVSLVVYDMLGRQVRTLLDENLKPGFHATEWDGRNAHGHVVASGVYHAVLNTASGRFVKKMVVLR